MSKRICKLMNTRIKVCKNLQNNQLSLKSYSLIMAIKVYEKDMYINFNLLSSS